MIRADEVMPLLLVACPSFKAEWEAVVEDDNLDENSPAGRLGYVDAGDFIRHLVGLVLDGQVGELPAVFDVIERLAVDGDDYVRNLAVIGYLEGLQMRAVTDHGIDPERAFRPNFGPESNRAWDEINRSWDQFHRSKAVEQLRTLLHWNTYRTDPSPLETERTAGGEGILDWADRVVAGQELAPAEVEQLSAAVTRLTTALPSLAPPGTRLRPYFDNLVEIGELLLSLTKHPN